MKISLAWLLDHIQVSKQRDEVTISALMERFNQVTAEIEGFNKIELPLEYMTLAHVVASTATGVTARSTEWQEEYQLSARKDIAVGDHVLVYRDHDGKPRWVTLVDVGSEKEGLMPAVFATEQELAGGWKKSVEKTDYILDVDNKSLTHRPDMWGHRGFAREVAALFDLSLRPIQDFMPESGAGASKTAFDLKLAQGVQSQETENSRAQGGVTCQIEDPGCDRFAGLFVPEIENKPSLLWMALRLARIDAKPMQALIDFTNYVMFDISQPMHAFDTDKLQAKKLIVRKARNKEQLELLDGTTIELTSDDLVVCDGAMPVSLGGIMGGRSTAVSGTTKALFLESAHWDPTTMRLTAARHKKRTDAAVRYEKNVDPYQNVLAITRYLKLCQDAHISYALSGSSLESSLISLGAQPQPRVIEVAHSFIEQRLGVSLDTDFVVDTLQKLEFGVERITRDSAGNFAGDYGAELYRVLVPTFRATKDIEIPEDIVEEVGRFYGYSHIPLVLPAFKLEAKDMSALSRMRAIKRLLANGCAMRELYTYAFFDEAFLRRIQWEPKETLSVQYAVSENWQRLVTSLIPNLLKAVEAEAADKDQLAFFEAARTWDQSGNQLSSQFAGQSAGGVTSGAVGSTQQDTHEKEMISGVLFDNKNPVTFYQIKHIVHKIVSLISMDVTWEKVDNPAEPWFAPYETARIMHAGVQVGLVGVVPAGLLHKVAEGYAAVFELHASLLASYKAPVVRYKPASKYPAAQRDLSMLVPLALTVEEVVKIVAAVDARITDVTLVDFFEKKEWRDTRSLTIRFVLSDHEKTLKKEEVDAVCHAMTQQLAQYGVSIR